MSPYTTLVLAWLAFGIIHSVLATQIIKNIAGKLLGRYIRYYRLMYSLIATITLLWVLHIHFSIEEPSLWRPPSYEVVAAIVIIVVGITIMFICIRKYFLYLSGIDVFLNRQPQARLEQTGLHAYVRHPLYAGTLLFVWGIFIGYPYLGNLVSCICITLYTVTGAYFEEKKLLREYGETYRSYQLRVPMLVPKFSSGQG